MTGRACDWIPDGALTDETITAVFDQVIEGWVERWFGAHRLVRRGPWVLAARPAGTSQAVAIATESARQSLLRQALGVVGNLPRGLDNDEQLLERFTARIVDDLRAGLTARLPSAAMDADPTGIACALRLGVGAPGQARVLADAEPAAAGGARDELIGLWIGRSAVTALRKQLCPVRPASRPPAIALANLAGGCEAEFRASLGTIGLSALELRDLAVGDVLMLDQGAGDRVALRAEPGGAPIGLARLALDGERLALQFQRGVM